MEHHITIYLIIIVAVLLLTMVARRLHIAYPVMLVTGGVMISFIPGFPSVNLDPALIFTIFLPPLLYEAAWYTSWKEFWKWRRVISSFAFLIVLITSLLVAYISTLLLPGFSLALGFLLGGIVSPPDAVSASAILKHVRVPRRVSAILEGESLLNDASSLVVFRFSLIAVNTGSFLFHEAATSFLWIIIGGIATGIAVALCIFYLHKWLPTDINSEILITLMTPYFLFLVAEGIHVSGVLSVVTGGLFLASKRNLFLTHSSRLQGTGVWAVLGFILNGLVFILIGLELPVIVNNLGEVSLLQAIGYGLLISVILMVSRVVCSLGASVFTTFASRYIRTADSRPGWKGPLIFGWAGMRGVVSLAAALSIPVTTLAGTPFPQRNLILFITFIVIITTLIVHGVTLPMLIKFLKPEDLDHYLPVEEQEKLILKQLSAASRNYLNENYHTRVAEDPYFRFLAAKLEFPHAGKESEAHTLKMAHIDLLQQQRAWLWELNKDINYDDEVIRKFLLLLDIEEESIRQLER